MIRHDIEFPGFDGITLRGRFHAPGGEPRKLVDPSMLTSSPARSLNQAFTTLGILNVNTA
jgi:hypothetical protein